ncbi:MAG: 5-formyltetrahydrofolate cyclo-ligase [Bacillota bacterium]
MRAKEAIREKVLKERSKIKKIKIDKWSNQIENNFFKIPQLNKINKIMAYASMRNEVKTFSLMQKLIDQNYSLYLPYTKGDQISLGIVKINNLKSDLELGTYGVQEPKHKLRTKAIPTDLDLIIVPGACFSKNGYRIGYGGGYYDSFLADYGISALKVGFCYNRFIFDSIPTESHDIPVDFIITEKEIISTK